MKFLVTGSAGLVGRQVVKDLVEQGEIDRFGEVSR